LDVFELRNRLVGSYSSYVQSFINIRDNTIRKRVDEEFEAGALWPDPLIQINPSFEAGESIDTLVANGELHPECSRIFRIKPNPENFGEPLRPYRHQVDAVRAARSGGNYVLTTGTGSGKSLAYIVPIVDHVLRTGSGKGIKAIIVYPMNALANSQLEELKKFLEHGYSGGRRPVTFDRYTGQESEDERQRIRANPPDILLTNYVMLELITTRPEDQAIVRAARGLRFLVLDELHTYRGRQGADVALLVRRVRDLLEAHGLQCVGTSATLAGPGSYAEQQEEVARMASLLFGAPVAPSGVIGETLRRVSSPFDESDSSQIRKLSQHAADYHAWPTDTPELFVQSPLASWVESTFGILGDEASGRLIRAKPQPIHGENGAARKLSDLTGVDALTCTKTIQQTLLAGYEHRNVETDRPLFAFRLHQFISRGDTVYASLEDESNRYITLAGQQFVPGGRDRILLPMVFCRECGQEYYSVLQQTGRDGQLSFTARDYLDHHDDDSSDAGYLYFSTDKPWPEEQDAIEVGRIPETWVEERNGVLRVSSSNRKYLPEAVTVRPDGSVQLSGDGLPYQFIHAPFKFCLNCGVEYGARQTDFAKLASLGSEGRSTATTVLTLSAVRHLQQAEDLKKQARKVLSFTDNRQDASLQAGHLNDFVEIGLLRAALYKAVSDAGTKGLPYELLTQQVFDALNLDLDHYAIDPGVRFAAKDDTERALREVLGYRLYRDLRRGWRVTLPNLEQVGLLEIRYVALAEVCEAEDIWQDTHEALVTASTDTRMRIAKTLLDYMRRELVIRTDYLNSRRLEQIQQMSSQRLRSPWAIDENEKLDEAFVLKPRQRRAGDFRGYIYMSGYSAFGQYLRRELRASGFPNKLSQEEIQQIIQQLLKSLCKGSLVEVVVEADKDDASDKPGYQLPASVMRWVAGDGTRPFHDPIRMPTAGTTAGQVNQYFIDFYKHHALENAGIEAREHTAQVPYDLRQEREAEFRRAKLPILFCSPTMELGVDISELNVVNMRNVPPTPANYAQRSGRAGRSGQPALVFTYCTTGSPHDQYFFRRPELMVGGSVSPPRLDLGNVDLVQSHIQAIWLAETDQSLGRSLRDLLDVEGEVPSLELLPSVRYGIENERATERARARSERVLATIRDQIDDAGRFDDRWLDDVFGSMVYRFDHTADRWRDLYRSALTQVKVQTRIRNDATRSQKDKEQAARLRREAEAQIDLLIGTDSLMQSDFYSYRYFASEGFLPGYSFPRLPLSAFIPARRRRGQRDEFLQRPRFLAISEFGPQAIVYHEGSRYAINQVILPVTDEDDIATRSMKQCGSCGYIHPIDDQSNPDVCERCGTELGAGLRDLFRLQNVSTRRRDRINSDEEERLRYGYEIRTGVRFEPLEGEASYRTGTITSDGDPLGPLGTLTYGNAATVWRINLGWARRKNQNELGFVLDIERGYWGKRNGTATDDADADPMSGRHRRVIPYVDDRRNCLIFEPARQLSDEQMASLQAALKNAIQVTYQLEDSELAAEPLPDRDNRRHLLLYESAEGGAGVLRRLVDDATALATVARAALELCHFTVDGEDRHRGENAREDCEAACYDCLMSYANQRDHPLLDRQAIKNLLLELSTATVDTAPGSASPREHFERLEQMAGSELERRWLRFLHQRGYHLPDDAQTLIADAGTRPDFLYKRDIVAAVYIDGPYHQFPERVQRDATVTSNLLELGYSVIRFDTDEDGWEQTVREHAYVFGEGR